MVEYEARGWHVAPRVFDDAVLDAVRAAIDRYHAGRRDHTLPPADYADWRPGDGDGVRNNEFFSLQCEAARALCWSPVLGAIAARLARTDCVRLFDDQSVYKPPRGGSDTGTVGWHTDHSYWSTCTSTRMLTAWVPLQDADADSGTLTVIDGSHRWPESEHVRDFNNPDLDQLASRLGRPIPPGARLPLQLRRGQVSFHHMRLLHASDVNRGPEPRYAVAVHLQDGDNGYRAFHAAGVRIVLPHDRLCRAMPSGEPDYSDPRVFPVLWQEGRSG